MDDSKFDKWNNKKKLLHNKSTHKIYYYPREVWWCALGMNIGSEEGGTGINFDRPVLIMKKLSHDTCLVLPLTTSRHEHKLRPFVGSVDGKIARALLTQVRVVDIKRLLRKIDTIDKDTFSEIRKKVRAIL